MTASDYIKQLENVMDINSTDTSAWQYKWSDEYTGCNIVGSSYNEHRCRATLEALPADNRPSAEEISCLLCTSSAMRGYIDKHPNAPLETAYPAMKDACSCSGAGAKVTQTMRWIKAHTVLLAVVAGVVFLMIGFVVFLMLRNITSASSASRRYPYSGMPPPVYA